jgi:hypothetical protein
MLSHPSRTFILLTKVVLSHEEKVELVPSDNLHVLAKLVESEKCKKRENILN